MNYRVTTLIIAVGLALVGCQTVPPGGLSEEQFNSLSPDRQAELRMEQETVNEQRTQRIDEEVDRINRTKE